MRILPAILLLWLSFPCAIAQKSNLAPAGQLSLGVRSSWGLVYEHDWNRMSFGSGGQFRLRFSDKVNSDWFFDFLQGDLDDIGRRTDIHIGWSVLYYPLQQKSFFQPYIVAGHCFEFLTMSENGHPDNEAQRKSASVQAGIGVHLHVAERTDLSFMSQYMMHFGTNIDILQTSPLVFNKPGGIALQDHILLNFSINYFITDLW